MAQVPYELDTMAQEAAGITGLSPKVIESQWIAENGWTVPQGYNMANIKYDAAYGNQAAYQGADPRSLVQGGFVSYGTPDAGVKAYTHFLADNPNYKGVMATAGQSDQAQLNALVDSPWDQGHYTDKTRGDKLFGVYNSISGVGDSYTGNGVGGAYENPVNPSGSSTGHVGIIAQLDQWERFKSLQQWEDDTGRKASISDPTAPLDWMGQQAPAVGIAVVAVLIGLILFVFGLVQAVKS